MRRAFLLSLCGVAIATAAGAEPVERRLHPTDVEASSFLWNDWNKFQENYHPRYIGDGDPKTAWVEGAEGSGAGEWVRLRVTPMDGATRVRVRVRNGYQKSKKLFRANARAEQVTLRVLPGKVDRSVRLADADGWQEIAAEFPAQRVEAIELRVDSVYPGTKYADLCVSDAEVYVTATTRENPAFEKAKLEKLLRWKAERLAAAKAFAGAAAGSMPVAPQYRVRKAEEALSGLDVWQACRGESSPLCKFRVVVEAARARASARFHAPLDAALAALKGGLSDFRPVQVAPTDRREMPAVDGICRPDLWWSVEGPWCPGVHGPPTGRLGIFRRDTVGIFAVTEAPPIADAIRAKAAACRQKKDRTLAWARTTKDPDGRERVEALFVVECGLVNSRDGLHPAAQSQLLVYGADGRLALSAGDEWVTLYDWREVDGGAVISGGEHLDALGERWSTWHEHVPVAAR